MSPALVDFISIGIVWIPLGSAREASIFPSSFAGEAFLLAANVDASSVDFRVSSALKTIQNLVVGGQRCDAGSFRFVGPAVESDQDVSESLFSMLDSQCHRAQYHPRLLAAIPDERRHTA